MKLSDYIAYKLEQMKIDKVFGYTGGSIADIIDSICRTKSIQYIQSYNEQSSAFAANAYAQVTGKTGVAVASSGPGAVNLINGLANAYYDSIPCVFITGNVHTLGRKSSDAIRQNAFQELNIVELADSVTKASIYIEDENDIGRQLEKAFYIANEGRKGPVLVDIPYDIQRKEIEVEKIENYSCESPFEKEMDVGRFVEMLKQSRRPIVLIGGGCQNAKHELQGILRRSGIPVVATMRGLDVYSHEEENYIGFLGSYGNQWANIAILCCDLLIVLGSRLDERQMGYNKSQFAPNAKIIQIDVDPNELGRKTDNVLSIQAKIEDFLPHWEKRFEKHSYDKWIQVLKDWKRKIVQKTCDNEEMKANQILEKISRLFDEDAIITSDVGQNQIVCAQSLFLRKNNIFLCSAGLACMGYSLPAAIGGYYASKNRQIISINGDGGIMMNLQELQTIKRERIPLKIIVFNNQCLGLIRKLQENLLEERYYASVEGYSAPDFRKLAEAFDFDYLEIKDNVDFPHLEKHLKSEETVMIEIKLPVKQITSSEPGENIYTQQPELSEEEFARLREQVEQI